MNFVMIILFVSFLQLVILVILFILSNHFILKSVFVIWYFFSLERIP